MLGVDGPRTAVRPNRPIETFPIVRVKNCFGVSHFTKALPKNSWGEHMEWIEQAKASIRAKVEHPFHVVKNLFRHRKTRYRGLDKNTKQLFTLFGLANLVLARKWLLAPDTQVASAGR